MMNRFETYFDHVDAKYVANFNYIENLVFEIMSTRENMRLIARTPRHTHCAPKMKHLIMLSHYQIIIYLISYLGFHLW